MYKECDYYLMSQRTSFVVCMSYSRTSTFNYIQEINKRTELRFDLHITHTYIYIYIYIYIYR
jgi:hypothetical protein